MNEQHYVATFNSTHHALMFEKTAKENDIKIVIMPVPRTIASSCGLAVKFSQEYFTDICDLISNKQLNYVAIYRIENTDCKKDYIKIDLEAL